MHTYIDSVYFFWLELLESFFKTMKVHSLKIFVCLSRWKRHQSTFQQVAGWLMNNIREEPRPSLLNMWLTNNTQKQWRIAGVLCSGPVNCWSFSSLHFTLKCGPDCLWRIVVFNRMLFDSAAHKRYTGVKTKRKQFKSHFQTGYFSVVQFDTT